MSGSMINQPRQEINLDKLLELIEENINIQECFETFD